MYVPDLKFNKRVGGSSETEGRDGGCGDGVAEAAMVCPCRRRWWLQNGMLLVGL